jgi:hypothetical protein
MEQRPINQRLTFLLQSLKMSARTFSEAIGESPTNTQNYVGSRNAEPRASYLENVLRHFTLINPLWLLTGEGRPFLPDEEEAADIIQVLTSPQNKGNVIGTNNGTATVTNTTLADCEKDLKVANEKIALLTSQVADKERIIRLYESQQSKS